MENIVASTQTFLIRTNIAFSDLGKLSNCLKTNDEWISVEFEDDPRNSFHYCITIIWNIGGKKISCKVSAKGVLHLTGCNSPDQPKRIIKLFWDHLVSVEDSLPFSLPDSLEAYIESVMRNVDFSAGFMFIRSKLYDCLLRKESKNCFLRPPVSKFTGIQVYVQLENIDDLEIIKICTENNKYVESIITYKEYKAAKLHQKKEKKGIKKVSISIFQTGQILLSGPDLKYQKPVYDWFINFIKENKDEIIFEPKKKKSLRELLPLYSIENDI